MESAATTETEMTYSSKPNALCHLSESIYALPEFEMDNQGKLQFSGYLHTVECSNYEQYIGEDINPDRVKLISSPKDAAASYIGFLLPTIDDEIVPNVLYCMKCSLLKKDGTGGSARGGHKESKTHSEKTNMDFFKEVHAYIVRIDEGIVFN